MWVEPTLRVSTTVPRNTTLLRSMSARVSSVSHRAHAVTVSAAAHVNVFRMAVGPIIASDYDGRRRAGAVFPP
jgi:hypothetical protein